MRHFSENRKNSQLIIREIIMIDIINDFLKSSMSYTTFSYFILVIGCFFLYYLLPRKIRWTSLLLGSCVFYYLASGKDYKTISLFASTLVFSYIAAILIEKEPRRTIFISSLILSLSPLLLVKGNVFVFKRIFPEGITSLIVPLGLSFYSLQIYSYLYDVYSKKITPQYNFFKYVLYISFFPQIMQGPIPRYSQLGNELFKGHSFDSKRICRGAQLILWGTFLKFVIAERAAIPVNTIFNNSTMYLGMFVLIAGILYSIQLYTDFLACVCMSKGVAEIFGISLVDNFLRPYFSRNIKEFWRRWHISLSSWLRDYIYIPLGGSRRGIFRKYFNLVITFLISGAWHGNGVRFLIWGLLHAIYQIMGDVLKPMQALIKRLLGIEKNSFIEIWIDRAITFFFVMIAWVIFRADTFEIGVRMIISIFTVRNYWIVWDNSLLSLGLDWKEWVILISSILFLFKIERTQDRIVIRDKILQQPLFARWGLYLLGIAIVIVFGTYGFGFNAADFIYRGF